MTAVGDLLELSYGKALKASDRDGGSVPVVGSGGVVGGHSTGITDAPTIVVGRKGSIGSVTWIDGPAWPIDTAYFVKPKREDLDHRWAYWMLRSLHLETMNKSAAVPGLNRDDVYRLDVELPALPEQRRVAAILDHADALRAKRRQVLTHLDVLTQSIFNDMFGPSSLERVPIGSFARVRTGSTPSRKNPNNFGGTIPWVKTTEVQGGTIRATSEFVTEEGVGNAKLKTFPVGSVVVAMYGQGKTRGQTALLGIPATTNQACAVIAPNKTFDPAFLQAQLAMSYDRLRGAAEGGNQPNLSIGRVSDFEVLLPAIHLQQEYTSRVNQISTYRDSTEGAMTHDDELFASLQSRAFRGEL